MQDDRTNAEATAGLLQAPTSLVDQMDERHGKFSSRLGLFGHLLGGGEKSDYGDADLQAQHKLDKTAYDTQQARGLIGQQFDGFDMNNLSMADVAMINQLDPALGKQAMENFAFNQRVGDLGRADGFLNDGIDDENDLWATETRLRHGKTANGQDTTLSSTLQQAGYTRSEFDELPPDMQKAVMYQHGTDDDRAAMDRVAGRQTTEQITADARAKERGAAVGRQVGEDRKNIISSRGAVQAQDQQIDKLTDLRNDLSSGEAKTGWGRRIRDAINMNTGADGRMDEATAGGVIDLISKATFGALSQSELDLLKGGLMDPTKSTDYNIETLGSAIKRLENERDLTLDNARASAGRYSEEEDYGHLMEDDWTYLNVGDGAKRQPIGNQDFSSFYNKAKERGLNRDQIDIQWNTLSKKHKEAEAEKERLAEEQARLAEQARIELDQSQVSSPNSPFGRKK
ncbi:hypothetical protein [uncultured Mediterranean phage uvMED]|nr:hypothetical protein [uncultured Mediterranean phage uvMED]